MQVTASHQCTPAYHVFEEINPPCVATSSQIRPPSLYSLISGWRNVAVSFFASKIIIVLPPQKALHASHDAIFCTTICCQKSGAPTYLLNTVKIKLCHDSWVVISSGNFQSHYPATVTINGPMDWKSVRFQFVVSIQVPAETGSWWFVLPSSLLYTFWIYAA